MGGTTYNYESRGARATSAGFTSTSTPMHEIFQQNKIRQVFGEMNPATIKVREARDSKAHPVSFPVVIGLDVTGSMGSIPRHLISEGLPSIIKGVQNAGRVDPAILFLALGDHECDRGFLQVGQFESGDEELDKWLTHTWIESGGGGNRGESYSIGHQFVADICKTDHWDKRKEKGLLITIGDEPSLDNYPSETFADWEWPTQGFTDKQALAKAKEQWHVYHIIPMKGWDAGNGSMYWKMMLGENAIECKTTEDISDTIKELMIKHAPTDKGEAAEPSKAKEDKKPPTIL